MPRDISVLPAADRSIAGKARSICLKLVLVCGLMAPGGAFAQEDWFASCSSEPDCSFCGAQSCGQPCCYTEYIQYGSSGGPSVLFSFVDSCNNYIQPSFTQVFPPLPVICQLDEDWTKGKYRVEIYGAIPHADTSCLASPGPIVGPQPTPTDIRWKKIKVTDKTGSRVSEVRDRIERALRDLAASGQWSVDLPLLLLNYDKSFCPGPRL